MGKVTVKAKGNSVTTSAVDDEQMKWQIEDSARTVIRAEEIKQDKEMWPKVQKKLDEMAKAAAAAAGV